jgi:hypothetical protein
MGKVVMAIIDKQSASDSPVVVMIAEISGGDKNYPPLSPLSEGGFE